MKPPQMNPEILRATTLFTLWLCVLGLGNVGCPVWSIVRGRSEKAYEAKMDVRPTSVPPPGRVLSAATLPHTLDEKKKGHSPQSLRKHAGFCLSSKQKPGPLSRSRVCISQSSEGSRCVSQTVPFCRAGTMETKWKHTFFWQCNGCIIGTDHWTAVDAWGQAQATATTTPSTEEDAKMISPCLFYRCKHLLQVDLMMLHHL